jgi:hypothetical protein
VADGHNSLSTQNWWCASRRLATRQQLVDPYLLGIHTWPPTSDTAATLPVVHGAGPAKRRVSRECEHERERASAKKEIRIPYSLKESSGFGQLLTC